MPPPVAQHPKRTVRAGQRPVREADSCVLTVSFLGSMGQVALKAWNLNAEKLPVVVISDCSETRYIGRNFIRSVNTRKIIAQRDSKLTWNARLYRLFLEWEDRKMSLHSISIKLFCGVGLVS
jgi:hypothetical protein